MRGKDVLGGGVSMGGGKCLGKTESFVDFGFGEDLELYVDFEVVVVVL